MALKTITSANAQMTLTISGLFGYPVNIEGFAMDSAWMQEGVKASEVTIGIDGRLSAGYTPSEVKMKITLSPDSPSKTIFDQWFSAMHAAKEALFANLYLSLPSTQENYVFTRGIMTLYHGAPAGKKKLEPVEYELVFQEVTAADTSGIGL